MKAFLQRHAKKILGVLSCFDRVRLRGSLRTLSHLPGLAGWLDAAGILLKDFLPAAEEVTKQLRGDVEQRAKDQGRPVQYLASKVNKEKLVEKIRGEQGVTDSGLIAAFSTLETCLSFDIFRNKQRQQIELRKRVRKCLHYYFYFDDGKFGQTQVRLMTWFPFAAHVVINGREWLAKELDKRDIGYLRRDNCFANIEDFDRAQKIAHLQPRIPWTGQLDRLLRRVHPGAGLFRGLPGSPPSQSYYWSADQTEWATDVAFRDAASLAELYPQLTRHGMSTFHSPDVMRFLGHKLPAHGGVHGKFAGEVVSDLKRRPEGVRIKHRVNRNSLKMYDKFGTVLRVETTLNDPAGLKVFRPKQDDPGGAKQWLPLRKSVADLSRRAALSQSANARYLDALGQVNAEMPLSKLTDKLCRAVTVEYEGRDGTKKQRRHRGLRPFDEEDVRLLRTISGGEFVIAGFRNRDVRQALYGASEDASQRRRQSARVSRLFGMLRAHGLIKKIPRTHRYLLTTAGRPSIAALLSLRDATVQQLSAA